MTACRTNVDDLKGNFQKNLQLLHEPLKQRVLKVDSGKVWERIDVTYSREGHPICKYKENGAVYSINSIEPLSQAEHWCDQIPLANIGALFVYGCGFGYSLFEILKKKHSNTIVFIFEQNLYLFVAMLHYFDLAPLFRTQKFAFFVGNIEDFSQEFGQLLSSEVFLACTAPSVVFTPETRGFKMEYRKIHYHLFDRLALQMNKLGNSHYDSLLGFHNIIDNINKVLENPYLSSLKDKFKNVPAFIIANGPSLDTSIDELKKVKGRGLILCSESAILPLMKNNINPDAICVLERTARSYYRHFENIQYPEDISLLALAVVEPRIFSSFSGPKIPIFRRFESNSIFINHRIGDESALDGGKSSAHLAYEAAVYMGANPIVLVGQDLAYGPSGATHSRQSVYAEERWKGSVEKLKSQPVVYVESNDGKIIPTNNIWYQFKFIYEQMIEQHSQTAVINATEGGARIKGTLYDRLANVIETYCKDFLPYGLHTLIDEYKKRLDLSERKNKIQDLKIELEKYVAIYRALDQWTSYKKAKCEQLLDVSLQKDLSKVQHELSLQYEQNKTDAMFKFLPGRINPLYFQQVLLVGFHRMNELGPANTSKKFRLAFKYQFEMFDHLNFICKSLVRNFQIALDKIATNE